MRSGAMWRESASFAVLLAALLLGLLLAVNPELEARYRIVRLLALGAAWGLAARALALIATRGARAAGRKALGRNLALAAFAVLSLCIVLEAGMMFVARSHRYGGSLAARLWFQEHWELNENGYRQDASIYTEGRNRKKVFVVGDSFAAGHGIDSLEDRFSEVLARNLGSDWAVYNLGVNGSDTRQEFARLARFPARPAVVVLAWVPNDIVKVAAELGAPIEPAVQMSKRRGAFATLVNGSYLANYLYYEVARPDEEFDYLKSLKSAYADAAIMERYRGELAKFTTYARKRDCLLVAVVFPFLQDVAGSRFAVEAIGGYFRSEGVPVVSVADLVDGMSPDRLVVNRNDGHPNPFVHRLVGDALHDLLVEQGL